MTPAQVRNLLDRMRPGAKPRKRRVIDLAAQSAWIAEMREKPGIFLPYRTRTKGNQRTHWRVESSEAKQHRQGTKLVLLAMHTDLPAFPVKVKLTRYGPGTLDAHDNLRSSMKNIVDGVADAYGVKDHDPRWQFEYAQERAKFYGVRLEITKIKGKAENHGN